MPYEYVLTACPWVLFHTSTAHCGRVACKMHCGNLARPQASSGLSVSQAKEYNHVYTVAQVTDTQDTVRQGIYVGQV